MIKVTIDGKIEYFENSNDTIEYVKNRILMCNSWSIEKVEDSDVNPFDVKSDMIFIKAAVRYFEDGQISKDGGKTYLEDHMKEMPCIIGDEWCPIINNKTGVIENWTNGIFAKIHYKVCDECKIALDTPENIIQEYGYVPDWLCPEGDGFGDYIIMIVDSAGKIDKWKMRK
jgi:hypothetical protein